MTNFSVLPAHTTRARRLITLFTTLVLGLWGFNAAAQTGFGGVSSFSKTPVLQLEAHAQQADVQRGTQSVIAVVLDHAEHYHTNLNVPIVPKEMDGLIPIPSTLTPVESPGITFGTVVWPDPVEVDIDFFMTGKPFKYLVYSEWSVVYLPYEVASDAQLGERTIELNYGYQACNETACLPPETEKLSVTINIVDSGSDVRPDTDESSAIFDGYDPGASVDSSTATSSDDLSDTTGAKIERRFLGMFVIPASDSFTGILILALSAAVGGFILNLTPCVLPVIPIKVMTISSHAGESKSRAFMLSMWMAIGVITFWVGIGIPVAFIARKLDPSIIFGIWWLTAIIGIIIAVMSFGIMGLFQIKLPQKVYMINPKADSASGSFIFGVMTAVLGLPCFGFVAGALLAGAATMPSFLVLTVFAFIGIGMAMPYVVLAMFPKLIDKLPRTGPASELIKHIMGLLMLAAAAYFLGTSVISFGSGAGWVFPWWGKAIHWWVIGLVGFATGFWLILQTFKITKRIGPRLTYTLVGLVFASTGVFVAYNQTMHQYHYFWLPFSPELLASSLESDKIVVLDFTAEWCLNCKALEATVLSRNPVKGALLSSDVVPMAADLTSMTAPGWQKLRDLGQTGIPLLVVYAPGVDEPIWLSNSYNSKQVVDAIEQARRQAASTLSMD